MTQKNSDREPNVMTVLMKEAADARGFKNFYQKQKNSTVIWVCFSINNVDYYYARGRLLEAGENKWGDFGRDINDKAQILLADKFGTKNYLKELGFNVPEGRFFGEHMVGSNAARRPETKFWPAFSLAPRSP